jgi:hypothetical protein
MLLKFINMMVFKYNMNEFDKTILGKEYEPYLEIYEKYYNDLLEKGIKCKITKVENLPKHFKKIVEETYLKNLKEQHDGENFGKIGKCHNNSQMMAILNKKIKLVEGYIIDFKGNQIHHSWNKIGDYYFDITEDLKLTHTRIGLELNKNDIKFMVEKKFSFLLPPINRYVYTDGKVYSKEEISKLISNSD